MNIFVLFFHNRARSLAYQVMKMWKKSCLLAAQAHHRQDKRIQRQAEMQSQIAERLLPDAR